MSLLSVSPRARAARPRRGHLLPIAGSAVVGILAVAAVSYLLWPTWTVRGTSDPTRLPISIGGTVFNVPTASIRMKVQRRTGPQDRIDLDFGWPSLIPGGTPRHITIEQIDDPPTNLDMMFLSIAAHGNVMAPEQRIRTIYPRYLETARATASDDLIVQAFRSDTPYAGEDLFSAAAPALVARCSRDAKTPGMCLSERRIEGADLTFRFPRSLLSEWRAVAAAMDQITADLYRAH